MTDKNSIFNQRWKHPWERSRERSEMKIITDAVHGVLKKCSGFNTGQAATF